MMIIKITTTFILENYPFSMRGDIRYHAIAMRHYWPTRYGNRMNFDVRRLVIFTIQSSLITNVSYANQFDSTRIKLQKLELIS